MWLSPCFFWLIFKLCSLDFLDSHIVLFTYFETHTVVSSLNTPFCPLFLLSSSKNSNINMLGLLYCLTCLCYCYAIFLVFFLFFKVGNLQVHILSLCYLQAVLKSTQWTGLLQMTNSTNFKLLLLFSYIPHLIRFTVFSVVSAAFSFSSWVWSQCPHQYPCQKITKCRSHCDDICLSPSSLRLGHYFLSSECWNIFLCSVLCFLCCKYSRVCKFF